MPASLDPARLDELPAEAVRARVDELVRLAVFGGEETALAARAALRRAAPQLGIGSASIYPFYAARGRGEVGGFTLPAVNIRGMTYDVARAVFRAMHANDAVAIFEINRAEIAFTAQEPEEFAAVVLAAAIAERHEGPVFIQLDHLMANARAFAEDPAKETAALESLVRKAVAAGFGNIDIDASTLVDLSCPTVEEQQAPNVELTARLAQLIRSIEAPGSLISIGGEIGEVGSRNSTPEELIAYADGVERLTGDDRNPLAKVSIQTGTTHGGIPLPDGTIAQVALDFGTLETLSRIARERYGMAGAVQHGASTLPEELFGRFPAVETAEVHLATGFQNLVMEHAAFPRDLMRAMERYCAVQFVGERSAGETDAQFFYKVRKKAWGPFKQAAWDIDAEARAAIGGALEGRFSFLFEQLRAGGTAPLAHR